jgi:hypothetical protein
MLAEVSVSSGPSDQLGGRQDGVDEGRAVEFVRGMHHLLRERGCRVADTGDVVAELRR